jgi:hypothetical protein
MFLCERYFPVSLILKVAKNPRKSIVVFEAPLTVRRVNSIGKTDKAAGDRVRQSLGQVTVCLGQVGRLKGFSIDITHYLWASESAGFTELELTVVTAWCRTAAALVLKIFNYENLHTC